MAGCSKPPRSDKPSIKYRCKPQERGSLDLADFVHEKYTPTLSDDNKQSSKVSEPWATEILSTADLVSAVGQIWDYASRPLALLQPKPNFKDDCHKESILGICRGEENGARATSVDDKYFHEDLRTAHHFSSMVQPNLEFLKVTRKMPVFEPWKDDCTRSFLWRFLGGSTNIRNEPWKINGLPSVGVSYELDSIYGWMREIIPARLKYSVKMTEIGNKRTGELGSQWDTSCAARVCIPGDTASLSNNLAVRNSVCYPDSIKSIESTLCGNAKSDIGTRATTLYSDYIFTTVQDVQGDGSISPTSSSSLYADYHITFCNSVSEECWRRADGDNLLEKKMKEYEKYVIEDEPETEICSPEPNRPQYALAKQEHAFAGAMAGICVSLCLHPVDTVKTVIQSCHADQQSICSIGRSIVSERGLTGLYRGITSNIASSAPISAIYTFTYESVKRALLPHLPKEYHSFAHCVAGGCASVATSFIFTPSERIKQQMQVGSHYQNCWNALVGVIGKGGLRSLYAGWGAVLCRNVPHSIIKFYTYERLKRLMLSSASLSSSSSSLESNAQPNTLQTLVCGGLAGSTAALFTTPFDVVKTRLQTQIPGSASQYNSVFHALQQISKQEGFKGLYRGLTPRLVMYICQGALFFTSYEIFKRVFSLDASQLKAQTSVENDSIISSSTLVSVSSSA